MEVMIGSDDDPDSATHMMTPDQLRAKLAAEIDEGRPAPKKPSSTADKAGQSSTCSLQIVLPNGKKIKETVSTELHGSALVSSMIGRVVPLPFDQSGNLMSWYRFEQDGERIDPTAKLSDLASTSSLEMVTVTGDTCLVEIVVLSKKGQDVRFSNPVSTVVPVLSLTAHLQHWLALPTAEWELVVNGEVLDPHMILDDVMSDGQLSIHLRIAGS